MLLKFDISKIDSLVASVRNYGLYAATIHLDDKAYAVESMHYIPIDDIIVFLRPYVLFNGTYWATIFHNGTVCYLNEVFMDKMLEIKC